MSKTALEQRNELFTAAIGAEYSAKGFTLNETEDCLELRRNGILKDRFSWRAPMMAIRNACQSWLIKEDGISYEAAK